MISSTLVANGATVYVIGKEQSELDKLVSVLTLSGSSRRFVNMRINGA